MNKEDTQLKLIKGAGIGLMVASFILCCYDWQVKGGVTQIQYFCIVSFCVGYLFYWISYYKKS